MTTTSGNPVSITSGSTVRMDVSVKNTGNVAATWYVGCTLAPGQSYVMDLPMQRVDLSPGQSTTVTFSGTISGLAYSGYLDAAFGVWTTSTGGTRKAYFTQPNAFIYS